MLRVLVYTEPVIFRGDPLFLSPHVQGWALPMLQAHQDVGIQWALASSGPLTELAQTQASDIPTFTFSPGRSSSASLIGRPWRR